MRRLRGWLLRLGGLFGRERRERELAAEMESHLQMHIEDNLRAGMTPAQARREALMKLGGIEQTKEMVRERRGLPILDVLLQDLRFGARMLRKNPAFAAVAVLTLALGIGVNTAIFTAFDALVLRPRPVKDPGSLASVFRTTPGETHGWFSYPDYIYYRDHSSSFSNLSLFAFGMAVTSSDLPATSPEAPPRIAGAVGFQLPQLLQGGAQPIMCFFVSGNYFPMLGATPLLGRILLPEDDQANALPVVLMSGNYWQRRFHSDPKVVGSVLHLNGVAFTIVGVTPLDYLATASSVPDLWAPIPAKIALGAITRQELENRLVAAGFSSGRLKRGASLFDAQAELNVLAGQLRTQYPEAEGKMSVSVVSGRNNLSGLDSEAWAVVAAAMTAVALLLLIACANVASLLLARAAARRKEIAVRLALGAGRWRLVRQLLTESVMIALLAGALGLPLAGWMLHLLIVEIAAALPSFWGTVALQVSPDIRIFVYTLLVSCAAGIAFGLAPALQASKSDVNSALKEEGSAFGRHLSRSRLRGILIAGQMAACLVLLISSALLLRGSQRALKIDPGFEGRRVAYLEMYNPANLHYSQSRLLQLNRDLIQRIASLPGVQSVAQASRGPFGGIRWVPVSPVNAAPSIPGTNGDEPPVAGYTFVTPDYFDTLSIPIVRGRNFAMREAEGESPVVVISEATAHRFWPGEDPLGKRLKIGSEKGTTSFPGEKDPFVASSEVIGVARDVRSMDLRKVDEAYVYLPLSQTHRWTSTLLARTEGDPTPLLPAIGQEVRRVDANLPVIGAPLYTMVSMNPFFVVSRIGGLLASIVGMLGLLLACMGVYGMVTYSVAQRTREIGIRMALGAQSVQVLRHVVREGLQPILAGIVIGIVASAGVSRLMAATLFGLNPMDAVSFSGVSLLLGAIALLATWLPARRATEVDPMVALRHE
ncbi:MAG TPA: ABC transporter permease [Candidatus Acidoferrales bacterium]|nr:ABC transporter permease [Candidatus Acidoferrales bacterium]